MVTVESTTTSSLLTPHLKRWGRSIVAGLLITAVQVSILLFSHSLLATALLGPPAGWLLATRLLQGERRSKVIHAWPLTLAHVPWVFYLDAFAHGLHSERLWSPVAVLSIIVGTLCFFGRDGAKQS